MLTGAEMPLWLLKNYRAVWIKGRTGGFKTSGAVRLAWELIKDGKYKLFSNMQCVWNSPLSELRLGPDNMLHAVVIFDEAGQFFQAPHIVKQIMAMMRRLDVIFMFPSYDEPAAKARRVSFQPIKSYRSMGIPYVRYKWSVKFEETKDVGFFGWWFPEEIHGVYSSVYPGDEPWDIVELILDATEDYFKSHKAKRTAHEITVGSIAGADLDEIRRSDELVSAGIAEIAEEIQQLKTVADGIAKQQRGR